MGNNKAIQKNHLKHSRAQPSANNRKPFITALPVTQPLDNSIDMVKVGRIRQALLKGEIKINSAHLAQKILESETALFSTDKSAAE